MWLALSIGGCAWVISLLIAGLVGYRFERISTRLTELEEKLKERTVADEPEEPKKTSSLIDPTDLRQRAQFEQDEMMRKLNP